MAYLNTFEPQATQQPAINTDAVFVGAAPTNGSHWEFDSIIYSYSAAPAVNMYIEIAWSTFTMRLYVPGGGPGVLAFQAGPLKFPNNVGVTITLKAGGAAIFGTVYPQGRTAN